MAPTRSLRLPLRPCTLAAAMLGLLLGTAARAADPAGEPPVPAPDAAGQPVAPPVSPATAEPVKRVVFLPETVRAQLIEEVKQEVLERARREGWAAPNQVPAWVTRFKLSGDLRGRFDRTIFPSGNASGGEFPDWNAINTGKPFDMKGIVLDNDRYLNVDRSRSRPRLRARMGAEVTPDHGVQVVLRLGSGENGSPLSNNQTLGASGGMFSKYQVWLDRAYLRLDPREGEASSIALLLGRFDNPFLGTDLLWWDDLAFDGVALTAKADVGVGLTPFLTGGVFPVYTTAFSYPGERPDKFRSWNKWLYAAQVGARWAPRPALSVQLAAALYDFENVSGRPSSPCDTNLSATSCDTDELRPSFAQKGNSYMELRTPSALALGLEATGSAPRYQYFGLASRFRELAATARVELALGSSVRLGLDGEYVRNVGFRKATVGAKALNNRGPLAADQSVGAFVGGGTGFLGQVSVGTPALAGRWDWKVRLDYRRLESDAVLDAFNDPDFGQGGTNLQGFSLDATVGLAQGLIARTRWYSANQVVGPKYAVDGLLVDVLQRF